MGKRFFHQGKSKTGGPVFDQEKHLKAKSTKELDKLIADLTPSLTSASDHLKDYLKKIKAERARRVGVRESVETTQFSLLTKLLDLMEFETPGLKLGALRLDTEDNCIYATIGGTKYKYTPHVASKVGEIYTSVTGMAKHSTGKALAYLKKNATGEKLNEGISHD